MILLLTPNWLMYFCGARWFPRFEADLRVVCWQLYDLEYPLPADLTTALNCCGACNVDGRGCATKLFRCSKCFLAVYCNRACQQKAFKQHKTVNFRLQTPRTACKRLELLANASSVRRINVRKTGYEMYQVRMRRIKETQKRICTVSLYTVHHLDHVNATFHPFRDGF
jgi:hypothetical protein